MAIYGSKDVAFVLVDGYDVTSLLPGGMDIGSNECVTDKITSYGDTFPRMGDTGSRVAANVKLMALYDDAAGSIRDAFVEKQGVSRVLVWNINGNTIGKRFGGYAGQIGSKISRIASDGKFHRANVEYIGSGPAEEGVVLHALSAVTAAGNTQASSVDWTTGVHANNAAIASSSVANPTVITTSVQHALTSGQHVVIAGHSGSTPSINGAQVVLSVLSPTTFTIAVNVTVGGTGGTVTPQGAAGYIACTALTLGGYTNVIGKVQHSADNSTFADLIVFAAITAAYSAERKTTLATVNQYLAASWAFTGSGSSPSATIFIGVHLEADV